MTEIPRKPTFPDHVIKKLITRIEQQVQQNVIPVSTGIYTQQKLVNLLQAIPKPVLVDYDQKIFFQLTQKQPTCPLSSCPICHNDYNNRKKPIMCHFCTKWACDQCICHRDRLHPLDTNHNGKRYTICYDCDAKYLSLQLNHPYVYKRMMIQTAIVQVSKQLQTTQSNLENQKRKIQAIKSQPKRKLNMKLSILKKQDLDAKKNIKKIAWDVQTEKDKRAKLQQKLNQAKIKYANMVQQKKQLQIRRQIQRKQREQRQAQQLRQQQRIRIQQQQKRIQQQIQKKRQQQLKRQKQQAQRIERQKQKQRLKQLQLQLLKQKQKQKKRLKQKQIQQQKLKQKQLQRLKQVEKQKQIQRQKQLQRKKQIQRQQKQLQKQKLQQKMKQQKLRKQQQERKQKQIQRLKEQLKLKQKKQIQQKQRRQREKQKQQEKRISALSSKMGRSSQFDQYFNQTSPKQQISHPDDFLSSPPSTNQHHDTSTNQISFTFDPSAKSNHSEHEQQTTGSQNSHRNSYLFNQFKSYFTQQIMKNAQPESQIPLTKVTSHEEPINSIKKQQIFNQFRRSMEQEQQKAAQSQQINSAKMQIFKQSNKKRRNYQDMKQSQEQQQKQVLVGPSEKCKCSLF